MRRPRRLGGEEKDYVGDSGRAGDGCNLEIWNEYDGCLVHRSSPVHRVVVGSRRSLCNPLLVVKANALGGSHHVLLWNPVGNFDHAAVTVHDCRNGYHCGYRNGHGCCFAAVADCGCFVHAGYHLLSDPAI